MRLEDLPSYRAARPDILSKVANGDGVWGRWRGVQAWELTFETPLMAILVMYSLMTGNAFVVKALTDLTPIITFYLTARYAVVGVHVWKGSQERQLAMREQAGDDLNDTGNPPSSRSD